MMMNRRLHRWLGASVAGVLGVAGVSVGAGTARASGCGASMAPLQNVPGCNLNKAVLGASLSLADSDLAGANLNHATVSGQAALLGSNLEDANLNGATISGLDALINAELAHANLNHAQIVGPAVGVGADLTGANLNGAAIAGLGDLTGAELAGANLNHATVSGTGAATGANLTGANLTGVIASGLDAFFDANLTGANLRGATTSGQDAFSGATWSHTTCPDGTNSDNDLGTCAGHLNDPPPGAVIAHGFGVCTSCPPPGNPGTPAELGFLGVPPDVAAGTPFYAWVAVEDGSGNIVTNDSSTSVTLAIGTNPSSGSLTCAADPVTDTDGIARFVCSIDTPGSGYTLSATSDPLTAATLGPFTVTTPPPAPPTPAAGSVLGGLDLDAYCQAHGYSYSHVPGVGPHFDNVVLGTDYAFAWDCVSGTGAGSSIDIQAACNYEYGPNAAAFVKDPNNAYSWVCVQTPSFSYYESFAGSSYLADGGLTGGGGGLPDFVYLDPSGGLVADGGLGGSSGLPDIVDSSGDGSSVTFATPSGGYTVAESGSLATGGAV